MKNITLTTLLSLSLLLAGSAGAQTTTESSKAPPTVQRQTQKKSPEMLAQTIDDTKKSKPKEAVSKERSSRKGRYFLMEDLKISSF